MRSGGWSPGPLSSPWRNDSTKVGSERESEAASEECMDSGHYKKAAKFRESNGAAGLKLTLDNALGVLDCARIPHLVTGGYAAQDYGCLRSTDNVDFLVPNVGGEVAALMSYGIRPHPAAQAIVVDPETTFEVRFHAGGSIPKKD
jgi:hypothetical protein